MTKRALWAMLLALLALPVAAQESTPEEDPAVPESERAQPVRHIRVLRNPYDIAKFYRSSQGEPFEMAAEPPSRRGFDPYSIAGYYRSSQSGPGAYGYSQFWSMGYSNRGRLSGYGRRMGRNGDLFLFAPTFLAPIGPLNGVFFGDPGAFR